MGLAGSTGHIANRHFRHAGAIQAGQGRNEAMQFSIKVDVLQDHGAVGFKSRAEIVNLHTETSGHNPICNTGRTLPPDSIDPTLSPAPAAIEPSLTLPHNPPHFPPLTPNISN